MAGESVRILVVEDDAVTRRHLSSLIRRCGANATAVGSLREALACAPEEWSGLILDLCLRDGPGTLVLREARDVEPDIPALIYTAYPEHDAINTAFDLHAGFLAKPARTEQLERFVRIAADFARHCLLPTPPRGRLTPEDLPKDLRILAKQVIAAAATVGRCEASYAERLGALARAATGRRLAGRSAMVACAEVIGTSRQVLQAAGSVLARLAQPEIHDLFARRDCNGRHITPSHLFAISRVQCSAKRELIERIFGEGLAVPAVRQLVTQLGAAARSRRR
jgi:CheY-like chemotaxis protein